MYLQRPGLGLGFGCHDVHGLESSVLAMNETAFEKHRQNANVENERLAYAAASEEWAEVATIEHSHNIGQEVGGSVGSQSSQNVTVSEAIEYFTRINLSEQLSTVNPVVERRGLCMLFSCLIGPPQLRDSLTAERDLVFAITKCEMVADNSMHWRMLQTVYKRFTGDLVDCPRFGSHWQLIGFQGNDPSTDFRGVGMLGLVQLLHVSTNQQYRILAKSLYRVSVDERQNFPLAVLSLNITCIALQALRHGQLNRECNQRRAVFSVFNEYYVALLHHFYNIYSTQNKTIKDTGYLLKDVECYCRSNVRTVLRNLQNHVTVNSRNTTIDQLNDNLPLASASFQDISLPS